jgi:hypothetical protein
VFQQQAVAAVDGDAEVASEVPQPGIRTRENQQRQK